MAYRAGHVPGSVNIRDDCLEDMLRHGTPFPAGRTIVLICPAGDYSQRLAAFLTRAGHDAASLAGGIVAWRDASLPLESSLLRGGRAAVAAGSRPGVRPVGSYPASSTAALSAARSGIGSAVTRTVPVPEPGPGLPNALSRPCPRHARGPRRGRLTIISMRALAVSAQFVVARRAEQPIYRSPTYPVAVLAAAAASGFAVLTNHMIARRLPAQKPGLTQSARVTPRQSRNGCCPTRRIARYSPHSAHGDESTVRIGYRL